jgi:DNA (cytosine-5)-methyltransferase 1
MIVDLFAGGGGASTGIFLATWRHPDVAVNHNANAIAMHEANHPSTRHLCASVWEVDPREVCGRRKVDLLWASPDCRHFSRAKGGAPVSKGVRSLAHVVVEWARAVKPAVICLENVEEFATWGPLLECGRPCPERKGESFQAWVAQLEWLGYVVEWRSLVAADYGAPTTRKRLFLVARRDRQRIIWPEPTHGLGRARPWRTAAEVIDWSVPCPSIFERSKPLAEATQRRIARGLRRFVLEAAKPFVVRIGGGLVAPTLIQTGYGERDGQAPRSLDISAPLGTVVAGGAKHALVAAWLTKHYGGMTGHGLERPLGTVTAQDHHSLTTATLHPGGADHRADVRAFLVKYYGTSDAAGVTDPLDTVTTRDRFGLVTVEGVDYEIADIGMRMLTPRELFAAQGFPTDYDLLDGRLTKTAQIALAGNSVCPPVAEALVRAQFSAQAVAA